MPFKKIEEPKPWKARRACRHPEHEPPKMIVLRPGTYEWECPGCGEKQIVVVPEGPTWSARSVPYARCRSAIVPHVVAEGARDHVVSWSTQGRRCSEPRCAIHHEKSRDDVSLT